MIAGSRNPMWGEEFDFYSEELPVEVCVTLCDPSAWNPNPCWCFQDCTIQCTRL
jgi:hypothetical protein